MPYHPAIELLEERRVPALIASQHALTPPVIEPGEVQALLQRAAAATASNDGIIAIVDRGGKILGVYEEAGVSPVLTGNPEKNAFAIDGAVALARTAAFFSNDTAALTSRTVQMLSESTITQREVQSDPSLANPNSPLYGPGFVAPIGIGGHFPPGVSDVPLADLFDIEGTNRDSYIQPGPDGVKGTADDLAIHTRFNVNPAFVPPGQALTPPLSYGESLLTPIQQMTPGVARTQSRGIGTLPGGIPLYKYGVLVGGIGVFFPGTTGYATEENSSLSADYNPSKPDRSLEAEFMGLAAEGGSSAAGLRVGTIDGIPPVPGYNLPDVRIDLGGITLDGVGPGGTQGPSNLVAYANAHLGVGKGTAPAAGFRPVDAAGHLFLTGTTVPTGWLVTPHAGGNLTAADVTRIINQGIATANQTRAQIRLQPDSTRMVFAVSDSAGDILGLYRMPDATYFSIAVAVAKARNEAYYDDPTQLQTIDQVPGLPKGVSMTSRDYRYLASPRFPVEVDGMPPGPFSILNDPGINPANGLNSGPPLPATVYANTVLGRDSFFPNTNFHDPFNLLNQNGVVFFPGSSGVYKLVHGHSTIVGGFGVSGDGVTQDDFVTNAGITGYDAPIGIRADEFFVRTVRLPYFNFPRNPEDF
jgi:uncharacterized protein GlcG (DUF336 family)